MDHQIGRSSIGRCATSVEVGYKLMLRKPSDGLMLIVPDDEIDLANPVILIARHRKHCDKARYYEKQHQYQHYR